MAGDVFQMEVWMISVIIPSLNDGVHLKRNLSGLEKDPRIEVIVIEAEKIGIANRAHQMNVGAMKAKGDLLVFLHADTKINPNDLTQLSQKMKQRPELVGGAFRFALDGEGIKPRLIEFGARLRELVFRLPYGDQAIFIRKKVFEEIGGYPEVPVLEDVLLIREMKSRGRLYLCSGKAATSARRWERNGYLRTTLANWLTMGLWKIGLPLENIAKIRGWVLA